MTLKVWHSDANPANRYLNLPAAYNVLLHYVSKGQDTVNAKSGLSDEDGTVTKPPEEGAGLPGSSTMGAKQNTYCRGLNGSSLKTVEMAVSQKTKRLDAAVCKVRDGNGWDFQEQFVFWLDFVEFKPDYYMMNKMIQEGTDAPVFLSWSITTPTNGTSKSYIQQGSEGFEFTITRQIYNDTPAAIYCYIGRKVQAKTISVLGKSTALLFIATV
ncbi:unnamed protein product [Dibothriocephalus latus]|uniref:Uncharacterized protein n=1 Tax=Dibothriocephalus latus TaxID=60516 RepID=A0A3P6U7E4_DIBLA|nr:unnamed protein product [Dibothriocephalus latus]